MWLLKKPKTILDFVTGLNLKDSDYDRLVDHIQQRYFAGIGPDVKDVCDEHFRKSLCSSLPPMGQDGVSWQGMKTLKDALDQGFNKKQAYKIGIPAIGIVAVLVANVAFVAWIQTPGGSSPYWQGCDYPLFTGFLIVNGIAFMLAVASAVVVTAFPLVLSRTPHQAAWWGGILLMLSMLAFILTFLMAGFVTVGYKAPVASCSSLRCTQGGIRCAFGITSISQLAPDYAGDPRSTFFVMDYHLALLNSVISNSSSAAVCVVYNVSVPHPEGYSTLYPWAPPSSYAQAVPSKESSDAITQLLTDPATQRRTVCMDQSNFPSAIDPAMSLDNLAVNISFEVSDLAEYLDFRATTLWDILPNRSFSNLIPLIAVPYFCLSQTTQESMQFNVLCAASWEAGTSNLSVSTAGDHISAVTAADSGAVLFDPDITAAQVATAIQALAGVFAFICLVIIVFLIRSKGS